MATNEFLPFATNTGANVYTQAEYVADSDHINGNQLGIAKSKLINKALRQSSVMSAILAQFISDESGQNVLDDGTTSPYLALLKAGLIGIVPTISGLATANTDHKIMVVKTESELFTWSATGTADNVVTFAGSSGFWVRQYSGGKKLSWTSYAYASGEYTINVPADFASINLAIDFLQSFEISANESVKIKVADGTYTVTSSISANHPNGDRIKIIGNETTPSNCVLQVTGEPTLDMIYVTNGNKLGYLNGFRINATTKATLAHNYHGIKAENGAVIVCGNKIEVNNFYYGIAAKYGATIYAPNAKVDNAGDVGIWGFSNGTVYCHGATVTNVSDSTNGYGYGIQGEYGGVVDCESASVSGCYKAGIASLSNSEVRALSATSSNNTGSGFFARDNASIECHNATASNNSRYGIEEYSSGRVFGSGITTTSNTLGNYAPIAYLDNTTLGARIAANSGDLRIDTSGANAIYMNNSNGLQFAIQDGGANTVNQPYVKGAPTGSPAIVGARGSDSVIDLALYPKGAGSYIRLGAGYTAGTITPDNYFSLKLNDGSIVQIPCKKV